MTTAITSLNQSPTLGLGEDVHRSPTQTSTTHSTATFTSIRDRVSRALSPNARAHSPGGSRNGLGNRSESFGSAAMQAGSGRRPSVGMGVGSGGDGRRVSFSREWGGFLVFILVD